MSGPQQTGCITVNLLSLGRFHLLPGETVKLLLHRHLLAMYLVIIFLLVGLQPDHPTENRSIELRGICITALIVFLLVLILCFQAATILSARRGGFILHLSPVLFAATLSAVAVGQTLLVTLIPTYDPPPSEHAMLLVFYYMLAELVSTIAVHTVLPVILAEVRNLPIRTLAETDPALWIEEPDAETRTDDDAVAQTGFLVVADRSYPFQGIIHLRAEGNYVHLYTRDTRHLLPGPLADLVGQLPPAMGKQVHRSHWVAKAALHDWQASGREITLRLTGGQTVPVAVTRRQQIREWLVASGIPQRGPT